MGDPCVAFFRLEALKLSLTTKMKSSGLAIVESALQPGDCGDGHVDEISLELVAKAGLERRRWR